jgi:hypothetical protein
LSLIQMTCCKTSLGDFKFLLIFGCFSSLNLWHLKIYWF